MENTGKYIKAFIIAVACAASVASAVSMFSGTTETYTNEYTVVDGSDGAVDEGMIREDDWTYDDPDAEDPEEKEDSDGDGVYDDHNDLNPGDTVAKDPSIVSNVSYDAYAFMEVGIPVIEGEIEGESGVYDVVLTMYEETEGVNGSWELVYSDSADEGDKADGDVSTYIYAYKEVLPAGEETEVLFDSIKVNAFDTVSDKQGQVQYNIDITGYLFQAYGYGSYEVAWERLGYYMSGAS